MTTPVSPGFLTPEAARVRASAPTVLCRGLRQHEPAQVQNWDYSADVAVHTDLAVDLPGLLTDTGLGPGTRIAAVLTWTCDATGLRGAGPRVILTNGTNALHLELRGEQLGGTLTVQTRVVLERPTAPGPLSPRRQGSTLWSDTFRITLEGGGARFPTIPLPFSTAGIAGGRPGAWALTVDSTDPTASAGSALVLYLNTDNNGVRQLLDQPADPRQAAIASFLRYDVTRQMLTHALHDEDLDLTATTHAEGSIAEVLTALVRRLFPGRDPEELRGQLRARPGELEAELQAVLGLLAEPAS